MIRIPARMNYYHPSRIPGLLIPLALDMNIISFFEFFFDSFLLFTICFFYLFVSSCTIYYDFWGIGKYTCHYSLKEYKKNPDPPFKLEEWHRLYLCNFVFSLVIVILACAVLTTLYFIKCDEASVRHALIFFVTSLTVYTTVHSASIQTDRLVKKIFDYIFMDDMRIFFVKDAQKLPGVMHNVHMILKLFFRIVFTVVLIFVYVGIIPELNFSPYLIWELAAASVLGKLSLFLPPKNKFRIADENIEFDLQKKNEKVHNETQE